MNNEERRDHRNHLRAQLRARERDRAALLAKREADPHSVDLHALRDLSRSELALADELNHIGGNSRDLNATD